MLCEISLTQKGKYCMTHLYVESKIVRLLETKTRMVIAGDLGLGKMGRCWSSDTNLQLQDK